MCSRKVRYWEEIYVFINVSWTFYIFLIEFSRKNGKCARSETDNFIVNFCAVLSWFYLWERIHDPVSVTWIAFNGKLMSFRIKIFNKQFVYWLKTWSPASCLINISCVSFLLPASLLRRCHGILYNLYFPVQQLER